jgi:hypothetical protein
VLHRISTKPEKRLISTPHSRRELKLLPKSVYNSHGNLTTGTYPPVDVLIAVIAGTVNALSRVAAIDGLYVAVGNDTTFFPAIPYVYLAVTLPAAGENGSIVAAITGETANRQNAAINTNANVSFFIQNTSLYKNIYSYGNICFPMIIIRNYYSITIMEKS